MSAVVGRVAELGIVERFVSEAGGGALAVVGEPGIGKTTVWRVALDQAIALGSTVLAARPAQAEKTLVFAGLADLLSGVSEARFEALPEPQRDALDVALLQLRSDRPPNRRLVGTALLSLLQGLSRDGPVVVAVDDLHWLDGPSAAALEFALRRLVDEPVCAVVSLRSADAEGSWLIAAERELGVERLDLGPLSLAALHRILADSLGRTFPRPVLVRIAEACRGNPLMALEVARGLDHDEADVVRGPLPVPDSIQTLVLARVQALPAGTREALLRAAALARPDARRIDPEELAAAEDVGLLRIGDDGRVVFTHPLFASAVYTGAPLARRRAVHRALAAELEDPIERAHHLALGCDGGPDETVARELELAAAVARSRAAPDAAAGLIDLALGLVEPGTASAERLSLELAEHLYLASDFPRARALLEELRTRLPRGEQRSRALFALAEIDYWRSGESAALALVSEALDDADDPIQRARCYAQVATYAGTVELERAVAAADAALELLSGHEDEEPAVVAAALAARVRARLFAGEGFAADEAERAYALEASRQPPAAVDGRVVFRLGQWLRYVDDLEGARQRLAEAEGQARDEGDDASLGNILLNQLIAETWAGSWDAAAERTDLMAEAFAQQGVVLEGIAPWRAYLAAHAGRIDEVRRIVGPPPGEPVIAAIRLRCLGLAGRGRCDRGGRGRGGRRPCGSARRAVRGTGRPLGHPVERRRLLALPRAGGRGAG